MDEHVDYYAVLGVDRTATGAEIAHAFHARAKELHPDRSGRPDTALAFQRLVEAHAVLSDPVRRRTYDIARAPRPRPPQPVFRTTTPARRYPGYRTRRRSPLFLLAVIGVVGGRFAIGAAMNQGRIPDKTPGLLVAAGVTLVVGVIWWWRSSSV